jgi:hypothetical protein
VLGGKPHWNRLLLAYTIHGDTVITHKVFDVIPIKNGITWVTMVSAYSGCGGFNAEP